MAQIMLFSFCQLDSRTRFARILRCIPGRVLILVALAVLEPLLAGVTPVVAQNLLSREPSGTEYPSREYYLGLQAYRAGDLDSAIDLFDAALRSARRDIHGRWVDSIPSLAMLAECHWHMGSLPTANEHLEQVFQIAIRSRGWFSRVDWRKMTDEVVRSTPSNLWPETRAVRMLPLKNRMMYLSGEPLTEARLARGGLIEEPSVRSMDVVEIMRGLAVASYRRRIILGPLSESDPLAAGLLESTKYPSNLNSPPARALIGSVRAGAHFASGDDKQSISNASNSTSFNGSATPLSAITMLTQGSAMAGTAQADQAIAGLIATVHVAGASEQPEWVGEALQLAAGCATAKNASELVTLAKSVAAVLHRESQLSALHCWIAGADAAITAGDLGSAREMLGNAHTLAARRDVVLPRLESYAAYTAARIEAASGSSMGISNRTPVDESLARVQEFALNHQYRNQPLISMPRIYQLSLVRQAIGVSQGGRTNIALLESYCQDAPLGAWRRDPVDAISGVIADRSALFTARVNLAASQGYSDKFLIAVDALMADRFNSQLPLGGRLSQIRVLSRTADADLDPDVIAMRDQSGPSIKQLRASVSAVPRPDLQQVNDWESAACQIALGRSQLPQVMPPPLDLKRPIAKLPRRTALLTFVQIGNKMHGMLAADGKISVWNVAGSGRLHSEVGRLLRGIGVGKNRGTRISDGNEWRTAASAIRRHLLPKDQTISADELDHLIVVPDGPLWYVPFELLPLTDDDDDSDLLGDRISISYAPTPGLALNRIESQNNSRAIGIASGPLFAPKDGELNKVAIQSIIDVVPEPIDLAANTNEPSGLFGQSIGHFVVAAPRNATSKSLTTTMQLSPHDSDTPYGTLAGWIRFPAIVPRSVIMVGLRTPIDGGKMGTGQELFMTMCSLNAAGVENVLLSRWAVGGESTAILLREFLQELPFDGMQNAWNRAKLLLRRSELDPSSEPLLTKADREHVGLTGDVPLFWSGYLISAKQVAVE